mmetsp:Transcript_16688/g.47727  ORF Transcript_16688/g.47727 Transcript_16688/m.47727 type:complete len:206 (+) Transcript_16688:1411-2028(+)
MRLPRIRLSRTATFGLRGVVQRRRCCRHLLERLQRKEHLVPAAEASHVHPVLVPCCPDRPRDSRHLPHEGLSDQWHPACEALQQSGDSAGPACRGRRCGRPDAEVGARADADDAGLGRRLAGEVEVHDGDRCGGWRGPREPDAQRLRGKAVLAFQEAGQRLGGVRPGVRVSPRRAMPQRRVGRCSSRRRAACTSSNHHAGLAHGG